MANKKFGSIRVNGETIDVQDISATTEINNLKEKNTTINSQLNTIENELGRNGDGSKITLQTTAQNIRGAINEVNTQFKDIADLFTTEQTETLFKIKCNGKVIANIPIGGGNTQVTSYTITNTLTNCSSNNTTTSITENSSYNATITARGGYVLSTATITMGGIDITSSAYNNGVINIRQVTGNIVIAVNAIESLDTYTITNNLTNCSTNNTTTAITENSSYNATITANNRYTLSTATITMGGVDITSSAYNNGVINIRQVTGNIVIAVNAIETTTPVDPNLDGLLKNRLLVWHDEFEGDSLDLTKWRYATHNSGGSEQQAYTVGRSENVRLENGKLILEAHKDGYKGWTWSSGRIDTCQLAGFKYGRLEAKLRYDVVSGAFPAFWTIGTCAYYPTGEDIVGVKKSKGTQWAQNGELDMFEGRGTNKTIAQGGWYNQDDGKGNQQLIFGEGKNIDASEYHVYAFEWTPTSITSYIDGVETGTKDITNIKSWQRPMYLILNMAVGSTGGTPAADCTSMKMEVDWVRVYAPVNVTEKVNVSSITLTQNNMTLNVGDDPIDVYYTVNPSTAWDNNVVMSSSNTNVATVYGSRITPVGVGNCIVTARATNGVTASINVAVATNASINSTSITLDKNTIEIYKGTSNTLIATALPPNHTDSILWKTSDPSIATVDNGVVKGINTGNCTITAYSSVNESVKAECAITIKEVKQLSGHPTNGLTLQLDRNGMSATAWKNKIDDTSLPWKIAHNGKTDISAYMVYDGESYYWNGANYLDHLTLTDFDKYYNFGESQTIILAGDFTNATNTILSNKNSLSQKSNLVTINRSNLSYAGSNEAKLGSISTPFNIDGCIALRYDKTTHRVDVDTMAFSADKITNNNMVLTSAFSQDTNPALLGDKTTCKVYYKLVLVYNRVLTNEEIQTAMTAIKSFF